jgi:hypothetical protein
MQAGMSLLGADAQSHLEYGKGLFSDLWKKNKGVTTNTATNGNP